MPDDERPEFLRTVMVSKDDARGAGDLATLYPYELGSPYARKTAASKLHKRGFTFARYREFAEVTGDPAALAVAEAAVQESIAEGPEPALIQGRDVLPVVPRKPGPWLGELMNEALDRQYRGEFRSKEEALAWAMERAQT